MDKPNFVSNLCYIINADGEVLLQYKKRGFGQGKWNGPGGKAKENETNEQAVKREVEEETGLKAIKVEKRGELEFIYGEDEIWHNHIYICREYEGEIIEGEEGKLKWHQFDDIPLEEMWEDDRFWLKDLLGGKEIRMRFYFDENKKLLSHEEII